MIIIFQFTNNNYSIQRIILTNIVMLLYEKIINIGKIKVLFHFLVLMNLDI